MVVGVILARGGSKGVPRKNLRALCGKPLIVWSIESALEAGKLDRLIVSTDDEEIAAVATAHGADVPFIRPSELARDDTPDLPVLQHALSWLEMNGQAAELIVHLRPTQPLREPRHIDEVVELTRRSGASSVKSVRAVSEHPHKMWEIVDGRLRPYLKTEFRRRCGPDFPRQQLEPLWISSGVVDAVRPLAIKQGSTTGDWVVPYVTDEAISVDLDTEHDFNIAESLLRSRATSRER